MDREYLYKWVINQLNSGISKSDIVNNVINYSELTREEAEKLVNDPEYRENFIQAGSEQTEIEQEATNDTIISKLSGIEKQLKEINNHLDFTFLSWLYVGLGVLLGWIIWG